MSRRGVEWLALKQQDCPPLSPLSDWEGGQGSGYVAAQPSLLQAPLLPS